MKAIAKKIKDNEWIAEIYKGIVYEESDHTKYPIVSPSDIEWLEANNMNGKEIHGELVKPNFYLDWAKSAPPIHSDPAGEEVTEDNFRDHPDGRAHLIVRDSICLLGAVGDHQYTEGDIIFKAMDRWANYLKSKPTPQTGREEEIMKEFTWWLGNNHLPAVSAMHFEMFLNSKKVKP